MLAPSADAILAQMGEPRRQEGVDLRQYARQAWRRKWLLLAVIVNLYVKKLSTTRKVG